MYGSMLLVGSGFRLGALSQDVGGYGRSISIPIWIGNAMLICRVVVGSGSRSNRKGLELVGLAPVGLGRGGEE